MISCERMEYSPNQKFNPNSPANINSKNLKRLFAIPGDDTTRFILSGDSQRAYDELVPFVKKANQLKSVDFVILNGDITDFGLLQEYIWVDNILSELSMPYIAVIGNHDHSANGLDIFKRVYHPELDFSFIYQGIKFVCHNTNSREYSFNGRVPDLNWLKKELEPADGINGYLAIAHVPSTNADFDKNLFEEYGKILTGNKLLFAVLNAHVDKESIQYPYGNTLPAITTNSLYNRQFLIVEIVNGQFKYYDMSF